LIVAMDADQLHHLQQIETAALMNGVQDIERLSAAAALRIEPALKCTGALWCPSTGIIDSHALMLAFLADAESFGAIALFRSPVSGLRVLGGGGIELQCADDSTTAIAARWVINAAGLSAVELARQMQGFPAEHIPTPYLAKGSYFSLLGPTPFTHLVYPVPEPGGLGVHLTLDLAGRARFGPDVQWIDAIDYDVDAGRSKSFYAAIRRYWPELPDDSLEPAYAGIRPKISAPGQASADFRIDGPSSHGIPGVINLFGIESPGLTASLAIADIVQQIVATE
jgi:L-2-hydroxyglutarate oxidase LhgO